MEEISFITRSHHSTRQIRTSLEPEIRTVSDCTGRDYIATSVIIRAIKSFCCTKQNFPFFFFLFRLSFFFFPLIYVLCSLWICQTPFTISGCSDSASHLCVFDSRKEEIIHLSVTTTATPPELFLGLTLPLKKGNSWFFYLFPSTA